MPEPRPDAAIEALVEELLKSTGQLRRRLRAEANPSALSWSQTTVLSRLHKDGPSTTADLARAEGVKPQSMGATLIALERDGLVERRPHATDGRQSLYELTPLGTETRAQHRLLKRTWLAAAMTQLDAEEQQALAIALRVIHRLGSA
ncbi:MAG: MarR family transcriptional regulator [Sphingomonas bacterium]|jgi:DNA-binding MarR family transcriptional regulator|nr:MarR family transcriptional regulator [Sphingomonas bacterium]